MATVVVTFFPLPRLLYRKMDAEEGRERRRISSQRRGQRWSSGEMNAQNIEEKIRALMKPVREHWQCFERDDAGLVEEYLTAAGLRAIQDRTPNFAEIGLVLQTFACNYSRKVDYLYHLISHFRSELSGLDCNDDPESEASPRRRRTAGSDSGGNGEFVLIVVTAAPLSVRRAPQPAGPPPSLPRQYSELRPRDPRPDRALYSAGEPIGSLDDFYVSRRTQRGHLVDELEADDEEEPEEVERAAQHLSLLDLQAAIERNAAGSPPPAPSTPPPPPTPPPPISPPPHDLVPLYTSTPLPTPLLVRKRKLTIASEESVITLEINVGMWRNMPAREFALPRLWVRRVVRARRDALLSVRRSLSLSPAAPDFRGFDTSWEDIGGFRGWARAEGSLARAAVRRLSAALLADSDDDGFFERSSNSLSPSLADRETRYTAVCGVDMTESSLSWQEEVARRAGGCAPLELAALARDVRRALPPPPRAPPLPWSALLSRTRRVQPQPARVLLDVLSKATSGELEVLRGTPGRIGDFSVRLRDPASPPPPPDP